MPSRLYMCVCELWLLQLAKVLPAGWIYNAPTSLFLWREMRLSLVLPVLLLILQEEEEEEVAVALVPSTWWSSSSSSPPSSSSICFLSWGYLLLDSPISINYRFSSIARSIWADYLLTDHDLIMNGCMSVTGVHVHTIYPLLFGRPGLKLLAHERPRWCMHSRPLHPLFLSLSFSPTLSSRYLMYKHSTHLTGTSGHVGCADLFIYCFT